MLQQVKQQSASREEVRERGRSEFRYMRVKTPKLNTHSLTLIETIRVTFFSLGLVFGTLTVKD